MDELEADIHLSSVNEPYLGQVHHGLLQSCINFQDLQPLGRRYQSATNKKKKKL